MKGFPASCLTPAAPARVGIWEDSWRGSQAPVDRHLLQPQLCPGSEGALPAPPPSGQLQTRSELSQASPRHSRCTKLISINPSPHPPASSLKSYASVKCNGHREANTNCKCTIQQTLTKVTQIERGKSLEALTVPFEFISSPFLSPFCFCAPLR